MLEVRGLNAWYGKSHILHGVDLDVREGEIVSLLGRNGVGRSTTVKAIMGQVAARAHVPAGILTYAEQRALEIGITIAGGADVILLDEPTAGMSRTETEAAVDLIRRVSEGRTLLIVEHDMSVVFGLADRVSVLVYGEIVATGTPAEIRANAKVREAYLGAAANA